MVGLSKKGTLVEELNLLVDKMNYKRVITANGFVKITAEGKQKCYNPDRQSITLEQWNIGSKLFDIAPKLEQEVEIPPVAAE